MSHGETHFILKSGRMLLLSEPFTPEEMEELGTAEGNALMEVIADRIAHRSKRVLTEADAEYHEILAKMNLAGKASLPEEVVQDPHGTLITWNEPPYER